MKKENSKKNKGLQVYQAKNGAIELKFDDEKETVWASQKQIAEIFDIERSVITKHIRNIFKDGEVNEKSNVQNLHIANSDKPVKFYNLDIILAVGYRTNSVRAIEFRKWATKILKQHITQGYTLNKKVLSKKQKEAEKVLKDLQDLVENNRLVETKEILDLVKTFSSTWFNLESYDKQDFPEKGKRKKTLKVSFEKLSQELYQDLAKFKKELIRKKEATELFAQEKKEKSLEGILGNVLQSAFGKEVYETVEEKAAHLLYFIIKNHPFNDGNKRTGAFSFIWFLRKNKFKFAEKISPATLTTLTLLIAESNPKDKDKMIGLVLLLLK